MAKFRWGILSTAAIAKRAFVPGVRNGTEGIIAAVGSRSLATAQAFAADLDIPVAHASYEALLADPQIDGVYIGLPNSMHLEWTIKAAEAGKHVLCEKPLARTVADARKMVDACAEAGVVLMEAFMYRHHPQHAVARQLIEGIGDVAYVRASFNYTMGGPRLENRDHRIRPDMEGGGLMDVGCYAVNAARFIYGAEPVEVTAMQRVSDAFEVDMSFAGVLRFPSGRLAVIDGGFESTGAQFYEVAGTTGSVRVEKAYLPGLGAATIRVSRGSVDEYHQSAAFDQYAGEADHFVHAVRAGHLDLPAENGLAQTAVIEALYESASTGRAVAVAKV
jgi:xylose dehydrogenase (NAD/NADP)